MRYLYVSDDVTCFAIVMIDRRRDTNDDYYLSLTLYGVENAALFVGFDFATVFR